ncbi:plasmid mobilization protein [Pontibacter saemangeumensis]
MENQQQAPEWKPKGGRPPMKPAEKRLKTASMRLTEDERTALEQRAAAAGYKDLSEYMRVRLLSEDTAPVHNPKQLFRALDKTGGDLKRIGTNINQITRYVHYLEKNNMVEGRVLAQYNQHFREFLQVEKEYVKAIRAYLRTVR